MTRKLRAMGLAFVAVIAMGAITAQGASAVTQHHFTSEAGLSTVHVTGDEDGGEHLFKAGILQVKCKKASFSGTQSGSTVESIELTPSYSECFLGGTETPVHDEGCKYKFNTTTTANPANTTTGESATVELKCETGNKRITITGPGCDISFTSQGPLHGIKYINEEAASPTAITTESHVFGITYTTSDTVAGACALVGKKPGTYTDGTYLGNSTVKGYEDAEHKKGTGIKISTT